MNVLRVNWVRPENRWAMPWGWSPVYVGRNPARIDFGWPRLGMVRISWQWVSS